MGTHKKSNASTRKARYSAQAIRTQANKAREARRLIRRRIRRIEVLLRRRPAAAEEAVLRARLARWQQAQRKSA